MPAPEYNLSFLASLVSAERIRFASIYDELAAKHGARKLLLVQVLFGPLSPTDPPYLRAFEQAAQGNWLEELVLTLLAAEAMREPSVEDQKSPERIELQRITRPDEGMPDAGLDGSASEKARRRVCMIEIQQDGARPSYGTGFLVGPQTILTNWHVVHPLLDLSDEKAPKPTPDSWKSITVTFDFCGKLKGSAIPVSKDWLVCQSAAHEKERSTSTYVYADDLTPDGFDEYLDFAVIRLQQAEGRTRGYYQIDRSPSPKLDTPVTVFQHPMGGPMAKTIGVSRVLWPAGVGTRLRHDANTTGGSSGGLVLNEEFELVALHQAGIAREDKSVVNAAIPTACIARKKFVVDDVIGVDPIWRIEATGFPVFGRHRFQEILLDAVRGETRIITVIGSSSSGLSFTIEILKDRLGLTEHSLLILSATLLPSEAREAAQLVLRTAGVNSALLETLPNRENADTAEDAWLRDVLMPAVLDLLRGVAGSRTVWLVVDDLHKAKIPQTGGVAFLQAMLQAATEHAFLRAVLLGNDRIASSASPRYVRSEHLVGLDEQDVAQTISLRAHYLNLDLTAAEVKAQANATVAIARASLPYLPSLVDAYRRIVESEQQEVA